MQPTHRVLAFVFVAAWTLFAALSASPPPPAGRSAAPGEFSAERAALHLDWIARAPHPAGSGEQGRVRDRLVRELGALGLSPRTQEGEHPGAAGVPLANVMVRRPGSSSGDAILFLCHYDSVSAGPGAGDDGAAVAAFLEVLRALGPEPQRNDLIFLFTDGEERGLLGARLFAEQHPWMSDVRLTFNFEGRGNAGPAVLFQTGPGSGALVSAYARLAPAPTGTSLAPAVYERLPNDTDFTIFLERELPGLNFAWVGGGDAYHTELDTAANLDRGSLQHHGETALALARHFGDAPLGEIPATDRVFFSVAGLGMVHYPASWSLALCAVALGLVAATVWRALRRSSPRLGEALTHASLLALLVLSTAATSFGVFFVANLGRGLRTAEPRGNGTAETLAALGVLLSTIGSGIGLQALFLRERRRLLGVSILGLLLWSVLLAILEVTVPSGSYLASWPLLLSLPALWLLLGSANPPRVSPLVLALFLAPPVAVLAPPLRLFGQTGSLDLHVSVAITSVLAALGLPLLLAPLRGLVERPARFVAASLGLAALLQVLSALA